MLDVCRRPSARAGLGEPPPTPLCDRRSRRRSRRDSRAAHGGGPDALHGTAELAGRAGPRGLGEPIGFGVRDVPGSSVSVPRGCASSSDEIEQPARLERRTRALARPGALVGGRPASTACCVTEQAHGARVAAFRRSDALLMPVMSEPAVPAGIMEGRGATATYLWESGWVPFKVLWNPTGQPAASIPAGFSATGLPLAVQLVGRPGGERTLLALSAPARAGAPSAGRQPPIS